MIKIFWFLISVFLIFFIFLRTPEKEGLSSFATKTNFLGSASSSEQFLNNLTFILIIFYLLIAIQLNFLNYSI